MSQITIIGVDHYTILIYQIISYEPRLMKINYMNTTMSEEMGHSPTVVELSDVDKIAITLYAFRALL